jgi:hypothetical protein
MVTMFSPLENFSYTYSMSSYCLIIRLIVLGLGSATAGFHDASLLYAAAPARWTGHHLPPLYLLRLRSSSART